MSVNITINSAIMLSDAEAQERCSLYNKEGRLQADLKFVWDHFSRALIDIYTEFLMGEFQHYTPQERAYLKEIGLFSSEENAVRDITLWLEQRYAMPVTREWIYSIASEVHNRRECGTSIPNVLD